MLELLACSSEARVGQNLLEMERLGTQNQELNLVRICLNHSEIIHSKMQNLTFAHDDIIYLNVSHGFTTCFIRGANRLAGMDGALGVAPRHAYDMKFASWLVSQ